MPANRAALVSFLCLAACTETPDPAYLVVDVATNLAPGVDFNTVRLDVFEENSPEEMQVFDFSATVRSSDSFTPAYRLLDDGEHEIATGKYLAELTLSSGALRIDSKRRSFTASGTTAIAFNISDGPRCDSPADCSELLSASCAAVDCIADVCTCVCGSNTDAGCESIEICANGVDDDGDSDVDCADADCEGRACDDGDLCTTGDVCGDGICNAQPKNCSSEDPCKSGSCNSADGSCIIANKPDGTACDAHPNRCCGGTCVNLSTDANNCGSCGISCSTGRCDDLGNGRAACFCDGMNANCKSGTVCYDPTGDGTHPDAYHCDCNSDVDCGSGAQCAINVVNALDHCFYE